MRDWWLQLWIRPAIHASHSHQKRTPHPSQKQASKAWMDEKPKAEETAGVGIWSLAGNWPIRLSMGILNVKWEKVTESVKTEKENKKQTQRRGISFIQQIFTEPKRRVPRQAVCVRTRTPGAAERRLRFRANTPARSPGLPWGREASRGNATPHSQAPRARARSLHAAQSSALRRRPRPWPAPAAPARTAGSGVCAAPASQRKPADSRREETPRGAAALTTRGGCTGELEKNGNTPRTALQTGPITGAAPARLHRLRRVLHLWSLGLPRLRAPSYPTLSRSVPSCPTAISSKAASEKEVGISDFSLNTAIIQTCFLSQIHLHLWLPNRWTKRTADY